MQPVTQPPTVPGTVTECVPDCLPTWQPVGSHSSTVPQQAASLLAPSCGPHPGEPAAPGREPAPCASGLSGPGTWPAQTQNDSRQGLSRIGADSQREWSYITQRSCRWWECSTPNSHTPDCLLSAKAWACQFAACPAWWLTIRDVRSIPGHITHHHTILHRTCLHVYHTHPPTL